ncbi:MAG: DUF2214 domain-containing protein [Steroidobacteraceae bacterium]
MLGQAVRGGGVWSYAVINLAHIVGVATLFGSVLVIDLRLLGLFARAPLAIVSMTTVPMAAAGFVLAAASGLCLLATNATEYAHNPFLLLKFGAIFVALLNVAVMCRMPAWRQRWSGPASSKQRAQLALGGGVSLAAWSTALAAGRMLGYW